MNKKEDTLTVTPAEQVADSVRGFESYLPQSWHPIWDQIQSVPMLGFLTLLLLGYLVAFVVRGVFKKSFTQITKKTKNNLDDQLVEAIQRPLFIMVLFFFLGLAVKTLALPSGFEGNVLRILASLVVLTWLGKGFKILNLFLESLARIKNRFAIIQPKTRPLFEIVGKILLIGLGSYILLMIWGIDPTAWLASAGVVGIAVGFAAKDTLANLFSGFFIIADSPYKVGDFVVLSSGERGEVTHVGMRSTRLLTRDDIEITVPNNVIGNAKITNENGGRWENSRIRVAVGAAYGSDVDQVCSVLEQVALDHADVLKNPAPRVRMRAFGASSLDFELLAWIPQPVLRGRVRHELHMDVYKAFNNAGIEIPYAKQDLYIKEWPSKPSDS